MEAEDAKPKAIVLDIWQLAGSSLNMFSACLGMMACLCSQKMWLTKGRIAAEQYEEDHSHAPHVDCR